MDAIEYLPTRPPFSPSPRATAPISLGLARSVNTLGAMGSCFRREAACPLLITKRGWQTWRWLCMPAGSPLDRDGVL